VNLATTVTRGDYEGWTGAKLGRKKTALQQPDLGKNWGLLEIYI
jgi:hypothetical protein